MLYLAKILVRAVGLTNDSAMIPKVFLLAILLYVESASLGQTAESLFAQTNLVAWCIVPFDTKKRNPFERADMLVNLGISQFAYDWRSEHVPSFETEIKTLAEHKIALTAWWMPAPLNDESRQALVLFKKYHLHPQLWVMAQGGTDGQADADRVQAAADQIKQVADAAAEIGSMVGLYNHGGWFGEPENQVKVRERLAAMGRTNVGHIFNLHHAHEYMPRLEAVLKLLKPHLLCLNLNGMVKDGDKIGRKILPFGTGDDDLSILRRIRQSGYAGPIGILGHTEEDANEKLKKELSGLKSILEKEAQQVSFEPGKPRNSGVEPGKQTEAEWVDDRWAQTDKGPFLASIIALPGGVRIAKGLSIALGGSTNASVAYDTSTAQWVAGWTGGFLKINPQRYGLIATPEPAQLPIISSAPQPWDGQSVDWVGLHKGASNIVVEYRVDGVSILEVPSVQIAAAGLVFCKTLEVAAHEKPLKLVTAAHLRGANGQHQQSTLGHAIQSTDFFTEDGVVTGVGVASDSELQTSAVGPGGRAAHWVTLQPSSKAVILTIYLWKGAEKTRDSFLKFVNSTAVQTQPSNVMKPGITHSAEVKTVGQRGLDNDFLSVDTLTVPYENPAKALMFLAGVDFNSKGEAFVCSIHGDVWMVSGIDDSLRELRWKRYASGLFQPLGLKVRGDLVYVLCRDRIVRLHDENNDGEADFYESFFGGIETSTGGHDYVTCLETDDAGNFYYVDPVGVHQLSPDGRAMKTLARGFRNPNGMGVSPDGKFITVAPQQGEWTPSSEIDEIHEGGWYGYGGPKLDHNPPMGRDVPLCWIPHGVDNSSGSQVWVPKGTWGPMGGQMLHLLWGRCKLMLVLRDESGPLTQGATFTLPANFLSGPNRGTFHNDALYVAGSTGWQTSASRDGNFQRVRLTGKPAPMPIAWKAVGDNIQISFSLPLQPATAQDIGSYSLKQWNYRYTATYGSKDYSVTNPDKEGHDDMTIASAKLADDGKTVTLEVPHLKPAMQFELKWNLDLVGGKSWASQMWFTIHDQGLSKPR